MIRILINRSSLLADATFCSVSYAHLSQDLARIYSICQKRPSNNNVCIEKRPCMAISY